MEEQDPKVKEIEEKYDLKLSEVAKQIDDEYTVDEKFISPWRIQKRGYLKLYVNQRKNPKKIGDTLMFSTHQTILASLYKDRLDAEWMYREEEDEDRADEINALWEFDYDEMGKPEHDFDKYFDASFYGIGVEDWSHFDRDSLTPLPTMWDPLSTYFDSKAIRINGNRLGNGACRRLGRDIVRTKKEMEDLGGYFNLDLLEKDEQKLKEDQKNRQARDEARGTSSDFDEVTENKAYPLLQWFTWIKGKRYLVEIGNERTTVVRISPIKTDYWPLQEHRIYPDPHFLLTPGTPDFTEDKQRARALLQNWTLDAAKLDVLPEWLFDKNKIKNKNQLREHKAGKYIEGENIDGNTIIPLQKPSIHQFTDNLMQMMQSNAEKALATPEIQQGILYGQKQTATAVSEASANVDNRYALTGSIFGLTETNGAYMWFDSYKRNFKHGIDKKMVRIIGAFGPKITPVTPETFKFKKDPDVKIESRVVSKARKREQLNNLATYGQVLVQTQGSNLRYFAKKMGRLMFTKDEVDRLIPQTIDEMRAEEENDKLSENSLQGVKIEATDDHKTHLEVHSKAKDTKAKFAHIEAHKKAMMIQRNNPEMFMGLLPEQQMQPGQQQQGMPGQTPPPPTPQGQVAELIQ